MQLNAGSVINGTLLNPIYLPYNPFYMDRRSNYLVRTFAPLRSPRYFRKPIIQFQQRSTRMTSPHPPSAPASGPVEQIEPAWNPGGRGLSYINRAGRRKLGVIGVLLRTLHVFETTLPMLMLLVAMPITAFSLGTWQVYRLKWKEELIKRYTDNLREPEIILPSQLGYAMICS